MMDLGNLLGLVRGVCAAWMAVVVLSAHPATAHPHVFVGVESTLLYEGGKITGIAHKWTFDELYSEMAVENLDTNKDGTYSREELAELTQVNMDAIKETAYYTVAKLGATVLKFADATDAYLEFKDGILSLHFTLPFAEPLLADALGLTFSVYDESFYIAFDYADDAAVKLAQGAPSGCKATLAAAPGEDADTAQLADAFEGALGSMGAAMAKTVSISCVQS